MSAPAVHFNTGAGVTACGVERRWKCCVITSNKDRDAVTCKRCLRTGVIAGPYAKELRRLADALGISYSKLKADFDRPVISTARDYLTRRYPDRFPPVAPIRRP